MAHKTLHNKKEAKNAPREDKRRDDSETRLRLVSHNNPLLKKKSVESNSKQRPTLKTTAASPQPRSLLRHLNLVAILQDLLLILFQKDRQGLFLLRSLLFLLLETLRLFLSLRLVPLQRVSTPLFTNRIGYIGIYTTAKINYKRINYNKRTKDITTTHKITTKEFLKRKAELRRIARRR